MRCCCCCCSGWVFGVCASVVFETLIPLPQEDSGEADGNGDRGREPRRKRREEHAERERCFDNLFTWCLCFRLFYMIHNSSTNIQWMELGNDG